MAARALAPANPQQHMRRDHRQVRQLRELCHTGASCALVPIARRVDLDARGRFAMVSGIAQESDRDTELDPHRQAARDKTLRAVLRSEARTSKRIFDSNAFAHGYRSAGDRVAGMPARELRMRGGAVDSRGPRASGRSLWKRSIQSLSRRRGPVKKKRSQTNLFFQKTEAMVAMRSACIGKTLVVSVS